MSELSPIVFVIDYAESVRKALKSLIRSVGLQAEVFNSPQEFLERERPGVPSCLIIDVRIHRKSGLDFQRKLAELNIRIPIIFVTRHRDVPMSVLAIKAGAVDFLTMPFREQDLVDAIHEALDRNHERRQHETEIAKLGKRYESLTPRQRDVLCLLLSGLRTKQIAVELGTTESAIKVHRAQVMRKMGAGSLAELVRMTDQLGVTQACPRLKPVRCYRNAPTESSHQQNHTARPSHGEEGTRRLRLIDDNRHHTYPRPDRRAGSGRSLMSAVVNQK
jgi:FixJ family two-component response regulator